MKSRWKTTPNVKSPKLSPIFVGRVGNIQPLRILLNEIVKDKYEIKILKAEKVRIQPKSTQAYITVIKELQKRGTEFHTFKLKQERSFLLS